MAGPQRGGTFGKGLAYYCVAVILLGFYCANRLDPLLIQFFVAQWRLSLMVFLGPYVAGYGLWVIFRTEVLYARGRRLDARETALGLTFKRVAQDGDRDA